MGFKRNLENSKTTKTPTPKFVFMEQQPHGLVYVLEDDEWYCKMLCHAISLNPDYEVVGFASGAELMDALSRQPHVITLDYRLPDTDGLSMLKKIKQAVPQTEVIIISEQDDIETAVDLLKAGADDYLVKSEAIRDRLLHVIEKAMKTVDLKSQVDHLKKEIRKKYNFEDTIIGKSKAMKPVFEMIEKSLDTEISVLITGDTGTGKEVVAKAIHYNSNKSEGPFVAVNMAAIPGELVESELFGHEKGAFTGALTRRKGKFEEAENGTIFLDEIGALKPEFQAKILRVLQEKEVTRVGSNETIAINCRILAATNTNIKEDVKTGNFREDLYFRLYGIPIELPPLRERGKDILILARHFADRFCKENNKAIHPFSEKAQQKLLMHTWPGNIRELKSVVELAVVMAGDHAIETNHILLAYEDVMAEVLSDEMTLREYDIKIVKTYLDKYDNDSKLVAKKLGIGQTTIYRMLKEDKE